MKVKVKLFATLRQGAGWHEQEIDLPDGATVAGLMAHLAELAPGLGLATRSVYAAVNQRYADRSAVLQNGDEVALFPPVSGGC